MVYFWFLNFIDLVAIYSPTVFYDTEVFKANISTEKSLMNGNFRVLDGQLISSSHDSYRWIFFFFFSKRKEIISTKPSSDANTL